MSASIFYQPVSGQRLDVGAPSSFLATLERAFGQRPWTLTDHNHSTLLGIAAALESEDQRIAARELAEAVYKHGEIRVWAEY